MILDKKKNETKMHSTLFNILLLMQLFKVLTSSLLI